MGFGSYDESEQESPQIDRDIDEEDLEPIGEYEGEIAFDFDDVSTDDLLEKYEEIDSQ